MLKRLINPRPSLIILLMIVSMCVSGVAEANNAPTAVGTIADQALDVGGTAATVDVSTNFSDADGDTLTYTASSSDDTIATASVSDTTVTITPVAAGTATITVTATDPGGSTAEQTISATVTQPNRAPTAVGTITDQALDVGGTAATVDVSANFSDPDGDTLTYTVSSSDTAIATVSVSSATVTITPVAAGTATITVTATDPDSATVDQTFSATVTQPNRGPNVVGTIQNQSLTVGGTAATVDVSGVFSDPDGDTLTYSATSSDDTVATVSVSDTTVTITAVAAGTATITVTATDPGGIPGFQTFSVTVIQPNRAPTTVGTIADQALDVGGTAATVDVSSNFSDADGDTLTYTATSSDTAIATVSVSSATVTVTAVAAGSATITVTATDPDNATVDQTFSATVTQPNRAPTAVNTISDQSVTVGGSAATVDVSSNFSDADGDTLTYTATSSDTAIATVSVSSATVTLTPVAAGTATITVTATDPDGLTAEQTIAVTVTQPNRAPAASGTIPDGSPAIGGDAYIVYVSTYFTDADNDTLTYTATSSDTAKATVSVSGATVTVTGVAVGSATITVTATDPDSATADQTFSVTVRPPNNAPTAVGTIPDQTVHLNGSSVTVDLSAYFNDADGDTLTYGIHNPNGQAATLSVSDGTLTIRPWRQAATVTITVTAFDPDNAQVTQAFTLTVLANEAPTAVTIPDQTLQGRGFTGTVDMSSYFSDADGDTLTYTATSDDTSKVTVSVSSATITLTAEAAGSATITVTATDPGGASGTQTFSVTVSQDNLAPVAVGTIPDQLLQLGGSWVSFNAAQYFSDPNGDTLSFDAIWRSNDAILDVNGSANWDVTLKQKAAGTSTVALTAKDPGGLTATQSFSVKVNKGPEPNGTIPDGSIAFGDDGYSVDVSSYFTDANGDALTYTAVSDDTAIATVSVTDSTVTAIAEAGGTATITVTATDTHSISTTQSFDVVVAYSGPVAVGTIADKTLSYSGPDTPGTTVDLSTYFDADDTSTLTYTAVSSDTSKATVSVSGITLTITPVAAGGTSTITARATDPNANQATQTFTVTVKGPPTPHGTIPNQTLTIGGSSLTINVGSYFIEPDGQAMTYTVTDSFLGGDAQVVLSISGSVLTLTLGSNPQTGSGTVTVLATDTDGHSGTQRFTLTVEPANYAPVASGTIPDGSKKIGESAYSVDLSGYFTDADGDTLTYTVVSSDTAKATVSLSTATLSVTPVAVGTPTITATATDPSGEFATQSFTMTVRPANRTPVASATIPAQKLERVYAPHSSQAELQMGDYFSDPDGDALTYTVSVPATPAIAAAAFQQNRPAGTLTLHPITADDPSSSGTTTITVTATDTDGESVSQSFTVTTSIRPATVGTIASPFSVTRGGTTNINDVPSYFSDADGDTLTYSVNSSDPSQMTVGFIGGGGGAALTLTLSGSDNANVTVTLTATDPMDLTASHVFNAIVGSAPTAVGTISDISVRIGRGATEINVSSYFSDADGDALTYSVSTSNSSIASVYVSGSTVSVTANGGGDATITVTASDPGGASASQTFTASVPTHFIGEADAIPGLSSGEQSLLGRLLTYDTLIFNELHNGSDDSTDWLELRNVSNVDIPLKNWRLTIQTGSGTVVIPFPAGTVLPTGEVLLITNTVGEVASGRSLLQVEDFTLPQTAFALILRSPTAFGDLAGNYFQDRRERSETAPVFTPDTVWYRSQATVSGYRAEAWTENSDGRGTPGYHPRSLVADLNSDGVVNILDLVLVASQFGTTGTAADLNNDGAVNIQDLILVANGLVDVAAAPSTERSPATAVNNWLRLARESTGGIVETSLPEGFSYKGGILTLEALARALTPETTALLANYPNPFNPETWIPYQLSKAADVAITIYAADGRVVRTLALGHQDVGRYHTRSQAAYWDGRNDLGETVASGVYFYTLTAGDFAATRKMLILK